LVAVITLGCPKNLVDGEVMAALLGRAGYILTSDVEQADAIVINTCAFIRPAREEAWERLEKAARLRREGRCRALIVAGCLAQGFAGEIRDKLPEADAVLGTGDVEAVTPALRDILGGRRPPAGTDQPGPPGYLPMGDVPRLVSTPPPYAYLKIAEGCSHSCAFCLIPSLRGPYRSRRPDDVVAEARSLERVGVREIVLVAQDTTAYGRDLGGGPQLAGLIRRLLGETGVAWLRLLYGYPATLPDDVVELLAEAAGGEGEGGDHGTPASAGRLCRYLDLPMQHASDRILRAMRRPETGDFLLHLVERLRAAVPGIALRSTFIVGFPGETEAEFRVLLDFLEAARLEHAGFFTYSPEAGTRAADMGDQVEEELKDERLARAAAVQRDLSLQWREGMVGRRFRVIVDGVGRPGRDGTRTVRARTEADAPEIDGRVLVRWGPDHGNRPHPRPGDFIKVTVTGARPYDLLAVIGNGSSDTVPAEGRPAFDQ
jgi:ribosomal protein S12 methylthiotransferase